MATVTALAYRRPVFNPGDGLFNRCLTASTLIGIAFLIAVLVTPMREQMITRIDQLPQRFAKLIVEKQPPPGPGGEVGKKPGAKGEAGPGPAATPPGEPGPVKEAAPVPKVSGPPDAGGRIAPGPVGPGSGVGAAGRARAEAMVASQLATTTSSLQKSLEGLSSSLASAGASASPPAGGRVGGRPRFVPGGRDAPSVASIHVDAGPSGGGGAGALAGSSLGGSWVSVGSLTGVGGGSGIGGGGGGGGGGPGGGTGAGGGGGGGGGSGTGGGGEGGGTGGGPGGFGRGSAPGVYRSNASLLAVIQRYAAGIQYCYGNELKRDPTLRGKLVVALTVAASGEVTEAKVVQNTTGSPSLVACALSQIRSWRFPPIGEGVTTFQAPFVFTPPS